MNLEMERDEVLRQLDDRTNQTWSGKRSRWAKLVRAQDAELDRLQRRVAELEKAARWQPIETAPKTGLKVILHYVNRDHKPRTVMARWLTDEQAAETDADGVGLEGGWYECIDNWDYYTQVAIHAGEPTHWMPLPAHPVDAALAPSQIPTAGITRESDTVSPSSE